MVGFIIFAVIAVAAFSYGLYNSIIRVQGKSNALKTKKFYIINSIAGLIFSITLTAMFLFIYPLCKIAPTPMEIVSTIFGGLGFGLLGYISLHSFILHYYAKIKEKAKIDKALFIFLMITFPLMFVFIFVLTNGFANYVNLNQPLISGFSFNDGFVRPTDGSAQFGIQFYALCILSGALYVYFLCDHKFYIQYGKHGILESTFLTAFPAGIIGARIFYVIGNWEVEFANQPLWKVFAINEGGLTILGGAVVGIVVGVAWFLLRKRKYNIWLAVDIIVPTILIAQGVGRWGNFFNCEVHGYAVNVENWKWLPQIILNNSRFSSTAAALPLVDGSLDQIYVPLFLIEGVLNFFGYFLIAHVFGVALRKYTEFGDLAFGYLIWYGLVRSVLEPLRHPSYNMGVNGYWSWLWSLMFVAIGALLIIGNHLVRYIIKKASRTYFARKTLIKHGCVSLTIILILSIPLIIVGIILMATNSASMDGTTLDLTPFNLGTIILVSGIAIILYTPLSVIKIVEGAIACNRKNEQI